MDYLITPRVLACMIALPVLNIICLTVGLGAGACSRRLGTAAAAPAFHLSASRESPALPSIRLQLPSWRRPRTMWLET